MNILYGMSQHNRNHIATTREALIGKEEKTGPMMLVTEEVAVLIQKHSVTS